MKVSIITLFLVIISQLLSGQDCTDYHQYHCAYGDYTFFYSRQSKSFLSNMGQTTEIQMVAYGGEDYYISVCANRKFGDLQFKILEDTKDRKVIYDNATNDYEKSIEFTNLTTRNLIIEVTVPEPTRKKGTDEQRCVGVVIQFRKTQG